MCRARLSLREDCRLNAFGSAVCNARNLRHRADSIYQDSAVAPLLAYEDRSLKAEARTETIKVCSKPANVDL